ncbi:MDR family MFS transporter [Clostridium beijerinckii]|uniref:EmrB/QacA subfamily drug resistance transporter n=1 Tax=Clostridium beijerinckii TaxID=1520 RepID=A0AAX0BAI6_CLOBE|nr:MDR family MFS transporter [Clostridium beijerinckii]NRT92209.1 EmrB/QacA subfamily drug resistance transporter [Clostridium beijerinckii]NYC71736.1 EmrB/QacA subfamily drug resistance transporter [Clostridium beijerinckii]
MKENKLSKGIIGISMILVLGALPPMLDATIVNIAVNDLAKLFSTTFGVVQWVVTGYTLALGIAVPFSGWLIQKYDGKKIFMSALGLFMITSLLSGFAWDIQSLIAFRAMQGFASGLMIPTLTTMIVHVAGADNLGQLMSIVGIPIVFGPIVGPIIGGSILEYMTWRWLFFVNLPIGIIALILLQWKLPKFEAANIDAKMDWFGILMLALTSGMFIYGITKIKGSNDNISGILTIAIGGVSMMAYVIYAWRMKEKALIPLKLFKSKNFCAAFISLFLAGFATNGPMLLFPMFFQNVRGLDVITSALWLIPQGVGMLVTRSLVGKTTDKIGARFVVIPSIAITIIGTLPFVFFDMGTNQWYIWFILLLRGMGVGGVTIPLMSDSYVGLEKTQVAQASVSTRIIQNIGSAFGSAILATVVSSALKMKEATAANISAAYHAGFITSIIFMVIGIIPALFLTNKLRGNNKISAMTDNESK